MAWTAQIRSSQPPKARATRAKRKVLHECEASVKFTPVVIVGGIAAAFGLAGCQHQMTLEEARAACSQQGGFLVVIYTQKITVAGVGPQVASPGNCVSSSSFNTAPATSASSAPPAPAPATAASPAPAAITPSAAAN
jgi:hypothetical protein